MKYETYENGIKLSKLGLGGYASSADGAGICKAH